ncbi:uracil-DNA glycosylase [Crocinitomicaceae bacterium]|nr:uracil-DNA glycosylase [Crocinitomicaceae bacterium]
MILPESNSWSHLLGKENQKPYFQLLKNKLNTFLSNHNTKVFPSDDEVFNAFKLCDFNQVKVVILGQDPYPTMGHAHGLSFSVKEHVKPLPKSLNNIFKALSNDLNQTPPVHGNLTHWAQQGVLLLNAVLTVEEGKPDSHKGIGWEQFTNAVIQNLSNEKQHLVFLLWGAKAQAKKVLIDTQKHYVLMAPHPSPLSAYRGFFDCKHFSKTNEYLAKNRISMINW